MRRGSSVIVAAALAVALAVAVLAPLGMSGSRDRAVAANAADFNPGYIISDENFYSGGAMSEAEVKSFLNAKNPGCEPGYTCLEDFRQTTWSRPADPMCGAYAGASSESAARIITKVARACGISPKVLLVTLQKEQSLVTATAPTQSRYDRAMGYACPDTAPCDAQYFGFYNQVYKSAWQFKRYANPPGTSPTFTWYPVGAVSQIRFHPNDACGTSPVRIVNAATAALYYYTPYQPNAAALANLYGTGDGCSAYGNRNFWRLYTDWFGSTTAPRWGSFDTAQGVYRGIRISGWSIDPSTTATSYIWVNVDGSGGPYKADKPLGWFDLLFPGYGPNHGFAETVPASPGDHEICVHGTLGLLGCKWVTVPYGQGSLDSVTGTWGGIDVAGWAVDFTSTAPAYVWVNVDGRGGPYVARNPLSWIDRYFPGVGSDHGFNQFVPVTPGSHEVCVHGVYGARSELLGCRTVSVPRGTGALDSVVAVPGGVVASGWSIDYTGPDSSFVWVNVDGVGSAQRTNVALSWLPNLFPGIGPGNGFSIRMPARKGPHRVCVYGAVGLLGCRSVTVDRSADGSVDTIGVVPGGIRMTGWSIDLLSPTSPSYIWVNVDGSGGPYKADRPVSWFDAYYPGAGPNHGFDVTVPASPGQHSVCVHGTESLLRCQTVVVP